MTTSSDNNSKSPASRPPVNHWTQLSDRLPVVPVEQLSDWLDTQLAVLEKKQARFVTNRSLLKSLRR